MISALKALTLWWGITDRCPESFNPVWGTCQHGDTCTQLPQPRGCRCYLYWGGERGQREERRESEDKEATKMPLHRRRRSSGALKSKNLPGRKNERTISGRGQEAEKIPKRTCSPPLGVSSLPPDTLMLPGSVTFSAKIFQHSLHKMVPIL